MATASLLTADRDRKPVLLSSGNYYIFDSKPGFLSPASLDPDRFPVFAKSDDSAGGPLRTSDLLYVSQTPHTPTEFTFRLLHDRRDPPGYHITLAHNKEVSVQVRSELLNRAPLLALEPSLTPTEWVVENQGANRYTIRVRNSPESNQFWNPDQIMTLQLPPPPLPVILYEKEYLWELELVRLPDWGYVGSTGPLVWHTLHWPGWEHCATNNQQSPINLVSSTVTTERPTISIPNVQSARFHYNGSTLKVDLHNLNNATTLFRNKSYDVQQFHFHTPSEHFVDGEFFPLEMHLVHRAKDGALLVLGVLIDITNRPSTPFIAATMQRIGEVNNGPTTTGELDFSGIVNLFHTSQLYQYTGSLTTPPCTPGVTWIVARDRLDINLETWQAAKGIMKFNARYIQNHSGQQNLLTMAADALWRSGRE